MIHVPCRQKHHRNPFLQVITYLLKTSWVFRPHHSHWALTTPCFVLILTCKNGSPPYVQGAAGIPLTLCFASLNVPLVPLTSTHNINFILQPRQTELTFLGHLRQHLTTGEFMLHFPNLLRIPQTTGAVSSLPHSTGGSAGRLLQAGKSCDETRPVCFEKLSHSRLGL